MANRYANLVGSNKIKDEWQKINTGFDLVQQDVDQLRADLDQEIADREAAVEYVDQRVDNIIVGGGPDKDPELVDIRNLDPSYTPQREINVAGDVTRDMQAQFTDYKLTQGINVKSPPAPLQGAKGDGVTDDTVAFQNIANTYPDGIIIIPDGEYLLTDTIYWDSNMIVGLGYPRLIFDNMDGKDGFVFYPTLSNKIVGAKNLHLVCRGTNAGTAIKTPMDVTQYNQKYTVFEFISLTFYGYSKPNNPLVFESVESWETCLEIGDAFSCTVNKVIGRGNYRIDQPPDNQFKSTFLKLNATNTLLMCRIDGFTCSCFYRGIDLGNRSFYHILHGDITHSYDGIVETGETVFSESRVVAVNINAQRYGLYLHKGSNRQVNGVTVRRHRFGYKTSIDTWYGFYFDNCTGLWLSDCTASPDESQGDFEGEHVGYYFYRSNLGIFDRLIIGVGIDRGIVLNDVTGNNIDNVVTLQNKQSDVVYDLISNTRSCVFGKITRVSTFKGTMFNKDETIGSSNTQVSTVVV